MAVFYEELDAKVSEILANKRIFLLRDFTCSSQVTQIIALRTTP